METRNYLQRLSISRRSFQFDRVRAWLLIALVAIGLLSAASGPVQAQSTIQSDDFAACDLAAHWHFVAGRSGDSAPTLRNGQLTLAVPQGESHDIWSDELSVSRVMQATDDSNFEVEIKYASPMDKEFQTRGILVEQANGDHLRFELLHNGANYVLLAASITDTTADIKYYQILNEINPAYMRVSRTGNTWTHAYSADGTQWSSIFFQQAFTVAQIGPYAGNAAYVPGNEPEHTLLIDYFYNRAARGAGDSAPLYQIATAMTGNGTIVTDQAGYTCNQIATLSAVPDAGWKFIGWQGDLTGSTNPAALAMDEDKAVTAIFEPIESDTFTLNTQTQGNGTVLAEPALSNYADGTNVSLTAQPMDGWEFIGWQGDLTSSANPISLFMNANKSITAIFEPIELNTFTLNTQTQGSGTVLAEPALSSYVDGTHVSLTAKPMDGWEFVGWRGDLTGNANPVSLFMNANRSVTAIFQESQAETFTLTKQTEGNGTIITDPAESDYSTDTSVLVIAQPAQGWEFVRWSGDLSGNANPVSLTMDANKQVTAIFQQSSVDAFFSDDFNRCSLGNRGWRFSHPGDATLTFDGTRALINVPAGADHDIWVTGNNQLSVNAARLMQPALNRDLTAEVKFESGVSQRYHLQGILIAGSSGKLLRIEYLSDGQSTNIFIATLAEGVTPTIVHYQQVATLAVAPQFLRVKRLGNQWTVSYSLDGAAWSVAKQFSHTMQVTEIGVYGGNAANLAGEEPAQQTIVDYFFNSAAPIAPEDSSGYTLTSTPQGNGTIVTNPNFASYACNETVSIHAQPAPGWKFVQWGGAIAGSVNPTTVAMTANRAVTALFEKDLNATYTLDLQTQGSGTITASPRQSAYTQGSQLLLTATPATGWQFAGWSGALAGNTNPASLLMEENKRVTAIFTNPSTGPTINVWYGDNQSFGTPGDAQRWINILGNVASDHTITSLTYTLNSGSSRTLNMGPDNRRLASFGDFNIEIDRSQLNVGANSIKITAVSSNSGTTVKTITVNYSATNRWPLPFNIQWDTVTNLQDVTKVVDGLWEKVSGGIRTIIVDYDRVLAFGDIDWTDYEVTVPLTINGLDRAGANNGISGAPGFGLTPRWAGHTDIPMAGGDPHIGWLPAGLTPWVDFGSGNKLYVNGAVSPAITFAVGDTHIWKLRVESVPAGVLYSVKVWPSNQAEPSDWTKTVQRSTSDVAAGSLIVVAHHVDLTIGDLTIEPIVSSASIAPGEKALPPRYQPTTDQKLYLPIIRY